MLRRSRLWRFPPRGLPPIPGATPPRLSTTAIAATLKEKRWKIDMWGYDLAWPERGPHPNGGAVTVAAEGLKFAFNAWMFVRSAAYFGTPHPRVLRSVSTTQPSMDIALRGNRIFHMHCDTGVGAPPPAELARTVALCPAGPDVQCIERFDFARFAATQQGEGDKPRVQVLVGHENGLSPELSDACGARVTLPQYGSVGSLSMNNALGVALARATAAVCDGDTNVPPPPETLSTNVPVAAPRSVLSSNPFNMNAEGNARPHVDALLDLPDHIVALHLEERRALLPLQLGVAWDNLNADRNIGATVRTANAYNCSHFTVVGRRKFSRRGTLGTHNYTPLHLVSDWDTALKSAAMEGHELWALWNDCPYVLDHLGVGDAAPDEYREELRAAGRWLCCDRSQELIAAVQGVKAAGGRGVTLVVPEEGCSHRAEVWRLCHRVLALRSTSADTQKGIAPAVAATVALERLRFASLFA